MAILNFKHKGLRQFFETGNKKGINPSHANRLILQLDRLDAAQKPEDMNFPGWDLHELQGDRKGTYAVSVNGNWRLTFGFFDINAVAVNYEDYH